METCRQASVLLWISWFLLAGPACGEIRVESLRCEYLINPLGVDEVHPRLSWILTSDERDQRQSAYQILVAGSAAKLSEGDGDLWDSGKVESSETSQIVYAGRPLRSHTSCYWKIRAWDKSGRASAWSEQASWTMGLLDPAEWKAKWIGYDASRDRSGIAPDLNLREAKWIWYPEGDPAQSAPIGGRFFRRKVVIAAGRQIKRAQIAVTADNRYTLFVNNRRTRDGSNFKEAVLVDVTEQLKNGENIIAVEAINEGDTANPAGLIGLLRIEYETGAPMNVVTDESWICHNKGSDDWMYPGIDEGPWRKAKVLGAYPMEPWDEVEVTSGTLFLPPAQYLRKEFRLGEAVRRAVLYASALGNYELYVNGSRIGDEYFLPGWTDYHTRIYYNTFDVTQHLQRGINVLGAILADGWYSGHIGWKHIRDHYGTEPRFGAQLVVEYGDGHTEVVTTDGSWKATTGPLLEADFLMGEVYDGRKELGDWCGPDFDERDWKPVDVTDGIDAVVESYPGVPVRGFRHIEPVSVTEPRPGVYVLDMGTNFAGFVRLKVKADRGRKIVLRFAEQLNPDGTIYVTNLRGARATDTYICRGGDEENWQPRFTFHGFQYVEVVGYPGKPGPDAITGIELTSQTPVVGEFRCSDVTANTLYRNICQTQRANFIDIPTDCPQRDERLGWMGDAQIYVRTATYNADVAAFFTKWLVDVEDAQLDDGGFSDVAPRRVAMGGGTAAWGDAGVICPWTIYQVYGDKRVLAERYDSMVKWIDYCKNTTKGLLRPASGYGDWLSIKADTPKDVLATAYFAYSTKLVAETANVLGKADDVRMYENLYDDIKQAFNNVYVADDGRIKGHTQTVYVLALAFDLLPEAKRPLAQKYLVEDIRSRDWHLSTGFVGTKDLMTTLTRIGRADVAYRLFHNDTFPSWGFSIRHGATSIWERWDGWTPEKGFQNPGMNSFAHYSFGAVAEWMFKTIAGIDTDGPGYRSIVVRPLPGGKLTFARARYGSINGLVETDWRLQGDTFNLHVTVPVNTTATVYVPAGDDGKVTERGVPAAEADGVRFLRRTADAVVYGIGSGSYFFVSEGVDPIPMAQ